ncbi:MAG: SMC family ATPase [Thermoproteota archaeon]|nr:SMC family ATPase [Thermoproteota archaeon]
MIKKLILNNFLSHKNTTLEFNPGITVFVGHNGSGKSSIIDSITFAFFNEHTRKSNKNLVTKGINQTLSDESGSFVVMDFSVGSIDYKIQRQINNAGHLVSVKLDQLKQNILKDGCEKNKPIYRPVISGERKQLGESVIGEIEKILGINYQKLQIASIIQQGEINKIIDSQPKEFKELLNNMIGLDRLDTSFACMHFIIDEFRNLLREKTGGYDDNNIYILITKTKENKNKIIKSQISLDKIYDDLSNRTKEMVGIEKEIEDLEPKLAMLQEMKTLENTLFKYLKEKSLSLKIDSEKIKKILFEVKNAISILDDKDEVLITLQMVQSEKEELNKYINIMEGEIGKLNGFTECAKKIQIKDGKCPVCNSKIIMINNMFDISHIKKELDKKQKEKILKTSELIKLNVEELDLRKKEKNLISAEKVLSSYDVSIEQNVDELEEKLLSLDKDLQTISKLNFNNFGDTDLLFYKVDEYSSNLIDTIITMKNNLVDIDSNVIKQKKILKNKLSSEFIDIQNQKAIMEKTISDLEIEIIEFDNLLSELSSASSFISDLEKIRSKVFNRDGVVSTSLRTWALNLISFKSSDYINTFNVGISKISLIEKPREIKVLCYGKRGEIDIISLSGGEKVAVSLALRMGIAYLMGSSKIDFIVLDEPTSNLDEERRRSFVKIISDVFSKGIGPLSQIIIITHDEEIFENSEIEQIYKFSMSDKGSIVTPV